MDVKEEERAEFNKYTYLTIDPNSTNTLTELLTLFTYRTIDPFQIGKANGLEATEVGLWDFTIDARGRFLWWQAETHHVKMFIVALVQS